MNKTLKLGTGALTLDEVDLILNTIPLELSYVDKDNLVKYYNNIEGEKLFIRTPSSIGRDMLASHPPKSKAMVEGLLNALKDGSKDKQDAWYQKQDGTVVHITFVAVRDKETAEFLGVLEYVQDITAFTKLEGENRDVNG